MNIERGLSQLGVAKAVDARTTSSSRQHAEKPAFSLPDHDAPRPKDGFAHARGTPAQRRAQDDASRDREPARVRDAAVARPEPHDDATRAQGGKPSEGPNAAARRDARDARRPTESGDDEATANPSADNESARPAGEAERHRAAADDTAALPDRMLALLSGEPLAAPPSTLAAGLSTGNTLAAAITDAVAPTQATAIAPTADAPMGMRAGVQLGALPAMPGDASTLAAALAAPTATAGAASTDTFAALAAFTDRTRDGASAPGDAGNASPGSAFAPLFARGADALQGAARAAAVAAPAPLPLMLNADFDDGLGARVVWMAEQRIDHAQIRVSPEALGPIDVRLQLDGHRVNAQFHAANADVRQALESGMDRLRDMLGRQGMELGQAQVGSGSRQGADGRGSAPSNGFGGDPAEAMPVDAPGMRVALTRSRGLLDEYA